jgi:hypothetical protein
MLTHVANDRHYGVVKGQVNRRLEEEFYLIVALFLLLI